MAMVAETDDANVIQTSYILANGMLLGQISGADTRYRVTDVQGSTRLLTDPTGAVTSSYSYDAFGTLQSTGDVETKYLYTGQQFDDETGLYSLRARYYNPGVGRFTARDVYGGNYATELNRYVYTANNPIMGSDPSGFSNLNTYSVQTDEDVVIADSAFVNGNAHFAAWEAEQIAAGVAASGIATSTGFGLVDIFLDLVNLLLMAHDALPETEVEKKISPEPELEKFKERLKEKQKEKKCEENPDDEECKEKEHKHIALGLYTAYYQTGRDDPSNMIFFVRMVELDYKAKGKKGISLHEHNNWAAAGIIQATTHNIRNDVLEALGNVRLGKVDHIDFNLTGIVPDLKSSYTEFANDGRTFNPGKVTSWELNEIRSDRYLCERTTFYEEESYRSRTYKEKPEAFKEICGADATPVPLP
jgi:RHS repeat-associated protein